MNQHDLLQTYVGTLVKSEINSLVIKGANGIGKSHTIINTLHDIGLKRGKHYIVITGHITPLQLFHMIGRTATLQKPRLIVFDDVDSIVQNKTSIALLKSALWEIEGKRLVSYHSSSSRVEGPATIEFRGKVIVVLNNIKQEGMFGKPLLDRGIMYEMLLQPAEVIAYVEKILPSLATGLPVKDREAVWEQVKPFSDNPSFSIRSLLRAMEFYRLDPKNYLTLYVHSLHLSAEQKILYSVREEFTATKDQQTEWSARTGRSRAEFFREKKRITTNH